MKDIRILHVDDSAVVRGIISKIIEHEQGLELVASARNGQEGVEAYKEHKPDLVIMDIEMPILDGIQSLSKIIEYDENAKVIMCSTLSHANAEITLKAMRIGAIDCIAKPTSSDQIGGQSDFRLKLVDMLLNIGQGVVANKKTSLPSSVPTVYSEAFTLRECPPANWRPEIIAVGSSTGGPQALATFMQKMVGVNLPIVITQHMPKTFTTMLAKSIDTNTGVPCQESEDGMILQKGHAILARGGMHLGFTKNSAGQVIVEMNDDAPESFCKPAVDVMYRELSKYYKGKILCVMLTGMGHDGRDETKNIVEDGGYCIAQDQETSVVWGMPGAVATEGLCSAVLPLDEMADWVKKYTR